MTSDELAAVLNLAVQSLVTVADHDWSVPAGTLEWSCWQTVDHIADCVFSYGLQVAAGAQDGFLPFNELHALPTATPRDLIDGVRGVGTMLIAVVRATPVDTTASDGVMELGLADWCARSAYEVVLHTHDVLTGLGSTLGVPAEICSSIVSSPTLWMMDRARVPNNSDPWASLLLGSGRPAPSGR